MSNSFVIGSRAFFEGMEGYQPHDSDELVISPGMKRNVVNIRKDGRDIFFFRDMTKEEFIGDALDSHPLRAGKFLVPAFAEYLGLTIGDLKRLKGQFAELDDRHRYQQVVFDSYVENGGFRLTEAQRKKSFETYLKYRTK